MIYKLTSSKAVVSKIFADLDIKEDSQRVSDIVEWIGEALEKIGSVKQLDRKVSGVGDVPYYKITDNQCKLPDDLFRLNQIAYSINANGPWFPMKVSTSSFNSWSSNSNLMDANGVLVKDGDLIEMVKLLYSKYVEDPIYSWFSKMDYKTALDILNTNYNARVLLTNLIKNRTKSTDERSLVYSIKPGYINTNVPSGFLKISYDAVPTDDEGYPMIPDNVSYSEAIYWYVVMKLSYPEYRSGRMRQDIYYDARRSWSFYCKQAYAESIMPTQDDMETIKNVYVRLMPVINSGDDFYDSLSSQEKIYNN